MLVSLNKYYYDGRQSECSEEYVFIKKYVMKIKETQMRFFVNITLALGLILLYYQSLYPAQKKKSRFHRKKIVLLYPLQITL